MTDLRTFYLPTSISGQTSDIILGQEMVRTWQVDGIFQIAVDETQHQTMQQAIARSGNPPGRDRTSELGPQLHDQR